MSLTAAVLAAKLVIGLGGISGVSWGARPAQVAAHWRIPIHFVWIGEHPGIGHAPLCARGVVGSAIFGGPGESLPGFRSAWFLQGAVTDRGIGIGSSAARARHVYGPQLRPLPPNTTLGFFALTLLVPQSGGDVRVFTVQSSTPPRTVIVFVFVRNHVALLGWGYLQALGGDAFTPPDGVSC